MIELNNQQLNSTNIDANTASTTSRIRLWLQTISSSRKATFGVAAAAIISGIATYGAMSGIGPFGSSPKNVLILLNIDLVLLLILGAIVAVRLVRLWLERRRGSAGSRLHTRLVGLFSLVSITPAILVAIFSALFLNFGLQAWFSKQVSTALDQSVVVAQAYMQEHREIIRSHALAIANDINRDAPNISQNPALLKNLINQLALQRGLSDAAILSRNGKILAKSELSFGLELERIPESILARAASGEVVILTNETDDRVRAMVRLVAFVDAFLYVGSYIESSVVTHVQRVESAVGQYKDLESKQSGFQVTFVLIFVVVALLVLLASIWVGLAISNQLVRPIGSLVIAAERVRNGELSARVVEGNTDDEMSSLGRAFNRMTGQLEEQRNKLIEANRQLDERRQFTETVLGGVSAGVIGVNADGIITLPNRSAMTLLSVESDDILGRSVAEVIPEMKELIDQAKKIPGQLIEKQIEIERSEKKQTLFVRVAVENVVGNITGYILTFDDITALVAAERTAAWADVARRIAHEIKNPLTPIQLSAERLKRKYSKEITSDPAIFSSCTDTIVRQVGDIRKMVDEFSDFARMPTPIIKTESLNEIIQQAIVLQQVSQSDIKFIYDKPTSDVLIECDSRQIRQCLTNLLKNAIEAIESKRDSEQGKVIEGEICVKLISEDTEIVIKVRDNGAGLPQDRNRLTEPYVTTRSGGTGLGLAIVSKIMKDHNGNFSLSDNPPGGTVAMLKFFKNLHSYSNAKTNS